MVFFPRKDGNWSLSAKENTVLSYGFCWERIRAEFKVKGFNQSDPNFQRKFFVRFALSFNFV